MKLRNDDKKNQSEKEGIEQALVEEIKLVFDDLKAVIKGNIPEGFKAHNTHLFTFMETFLANGEHYHYWRSSLIWVSMRTRPVCLFSVS